MPRSLGHACAAPYSVLPCVEVWTEASAGAGSCLGLPRAASCLLPAEAAWAGLT